MLSVNVINIEHVVRQLLGVRMARPGSFYNGTSCLKLVLYSATSLLGLSFRYLKFPVYGFVVKVRF